MKLKDLIPLNEANPDGTISPDEDQKMDKLKKVLERDILAFNKKVQKHYNQVLKSMILLKLRKKKRKRIKIN